MLQNESYEITANVGRTRNLLGGLVALYSLENETLSECTEQKVHAADHAHFFFKAYEASLIKARALGIVDPAYLERHIEILRSTPSIADNMAFLIRLTSELKLIVEEYLEKVQGYRELTGRPQPLMAVVLNDGDAGAEIRKHQKRNMRSGW
jgi:hypothetical protein